MGTLSSLYPQLTAQAPGLSDIVAGQQMMYAARKFCDETKIVNQVLPTVVASTQDVTVPNPANLELCGFLRITCGGRTLWARSEAAIDAALGSTDYMSFPTSGTPGDVIVLNRNQIRLVPAPSVPQSLVILAAVRPTLTATTVPDVLVDRWYDAIISGALSRILLTPGQSYTNIALAQAHGAAFGLEINKARIVLNTSDSRNGTRVRGPSFTGR